MSKTVLNWNSLTSLIILQIKNERLLKAATKELQLRTKIEEEKTKIGGTNKKERENERKTAWKDKTLNGQFLKETEGMQD